MEGEMWRAASGRIIWNGASDLSIGWGGVGGGCSFRLSASSLQGETRHLSPPVTEGW